MNRVQENLASTLLPVHLGRQAETGAWEGLISLLTTGITGYTAVQQAQEQRKAAEAAAEIERLRLAQAAAQAPTARLSRFLGQYWPHLTVGGATLVTLALIFRKKK